MLDRIFHFTRLPAPAAAASSDAAGPAAAVQPRWRSSFALSDREAQFLTDVLEHRQARMLHGRTVDDKEPIPPGEPAGHTSWGGLQVWCREPRRRPAGALVARCTTGLLLALPDGTVMRLGAMPCASRACTHVAARCTQAHWCRPASGRTPPAARRCGGPTKSGTARATT